jgi:hypothetical protein
MANYLLSVHTGPGGKPPTQEQMQDTGQRLGQLEDELKSTGAWLFSGRLADPDTATVVRSTTGDVITTDGPYLESKEHIAGFYIITADDLDTALSWASQITAIINEPIEVRPFAGLST